jgi:hypothetical protein
MSVFERVLGRLNSVWNKDPQRAEVAKLYKTGAVFTIDDVTCTVFDNGATYKVPLGDGTINEFLFSMVRKGFTFDLVGEMLTAENIDIDATIADYLESHPVAAEDEEETYYFLRTALRYELDTRTLVEFFTEMDAQGWNIKFLPIGIGGQLARGIIPQNDTVTGGSIAIHQSILWSELKPQCWTMTEQKNRITAAEKELYLHSADTRWLDLWGEYFRIGRSEGEIDHDYLLRIIAETIKPKTNNISLAKMLMEAFPSCQCFVTDSMDVSSIPVLHDGTEIHDGQWYHNNDGSGGGFDGYFRVRILAPTGYKTNEQILSIATGLINRAKASGTLVEWIDIDRT